MEMTEQLLSDGRRFDFFQALRLLDHALRAGGAKEDDTTAAIRIRPQLSLSFPPADIETIERIKADERALFRITANFMGLYGAASPLPTFYTEDLITEENEDESACRDFLDIFHHRLYTLLYSGWKKYRLFFEIAESANAKNLEQLYCLIGLGHAGLHPGRIDTYRLLRYIGLFTQFPRSAAGLQALLADALGGVPVSIVPCVLRRAKIPENQRLRMGIARSQLGWDSYLGEEIEDRMSQCRIRIGPLTLVDFLRFTPGQADHEELKTLSDLYLTEPLVLEVELVLAPNEAKTVRLGDPMHSMLGVTTWVFSSPSLGEVRTRFLLNRFEEMKL
jgi:type VI secretion system protein ImpH